MADIQNEGLWEKIRYFKVHNAGAFVARIHVLCSVRDGKVLKRVELKEPGYQDICASTERTVDLADLRYTDSAGHEHPLADGAPVQLKVVVVAGKDKTAEEEFAFSPRSGAMKTYKISGTTLNSTLALVE